MKKNILIIFLLGIFFLFPYDTEAYTVKKVDADYFSIFETEQYTYEISIDNYDVDNSSIYVYLNRKEKEKISNNVLNNITDDKYKCENNNYEKCLMTVNDDLSLKLKKEWLKDNLYAYIIISNETEVLYTDKSIKIDRVVTYDKNTYNLDNRYTIENKVTGDMRKKNNYLYITPQNNIVRNSEQELKVKIGIIRKLEVLNKIRNDDENAYYDLIQYAKEDKYGEYVTLNLSDNKKYVGDIKHLNVISGAYYYIYVEEAKNVQEGIIFAQGRWRLLESEIVWPNKTLMGIGLTIFTLDMSLPIFAIAYLFISSKKEGN